MFFFFNNCFFFNDCFLSQQLAGARAGLTAGAAAGSAARLHGAADQNHPAQQGEPGPASAAAGEEKHA